MGLPPLAPPAGVHLALPSDRAAPRPGVLPAGSIQHWEAGLARTCSEEHSVLSPVPIVLVHALRCLPPREAIAIVDAALNRRLTTVADLVDQRPRAGNLYFDRLLRSVDGRSQALPETFARLALRSAGLAVDPQVLMVGVDHVDLLVEDLAVVEIDGFAYHRDRAQFGVERGPGEAGVARKAAITARSPHQFRAPR